MAWVVIAASLCAGVATAQQTIDGVTAGGALYRFLVPGSWNGQLVVYAHGYVSAGDPIGLPNTLIEQAAFQAITSQGFAVAMSSYAENGWAVKNGAQTTHQLRGLFAARVSNPTRTYLVGTSEGGLITLDLTEGFPGQYDGTLAICGVVGGTPLHFQHVGDGRVLFDYFFPGVLPGDLLHMPNLDFSPGSPTYTAVANSLIAGLFVPGQPTLQFANVAGLPGSNVNEIIFSGLTLVGGFTALNELLQRTYGHHFYDNTETVYSGSANDPALNAGVRRYSADQAGMNYAAHYRPQRTPSHTHPHTPHYPGSNGSFFSGSALRRGGCRGQCLGLFGSAVGKSVRALQCETRRDTEFIPRFIPVGELWHQAPQRRCNCAVIGIC
jgi:hypothetical protein